MMSRQVADFVARLREPYTLLCLLMMLGIVNLWRARRESRNRLLLLTIPFGLLMVLSNPWVGYLSLGSLEWQYPPLGHRPADAEAIVVLGGGILPANAVRTRAELNQDSLYRCLHSADVYRQGRPCPVLLSGGKTEPDTPTLARAMRAMLEELGVSSSDIIEEGDSLNTYENAVKCSEL
ncbi:MAG: YdcF family protein, partial [Planctomycetaceae bacterium]|nr:YdcF family protein [Planctomycetaceae bacterium]